MMKKKRDFIWAGIGFGAVYWIMESVRDVLVFEKGTLLERVFLPDTMSFWRRFPVILILILYSIYVQSLGDKFEYSQTFSISNRVHCNPNNHRYCM